MSAFGSGQTMAGLAPAALTFGGFWARTGAFLIDGIILGVINGVLFGTMGPGFMTQTADPENLPFGLLLAIMGVSMLIPAIYTIGFWTSAGATPGKMALGLKVVRSVDGGPLTTGQAIGRFLGYIVSNLVFCLGFLWVAFDGRKQGWHDKLASTVVVRRSRVEPVAFGR